MQIYQLKLKLLVNNSRNEATKNLIRRKLYFKFFNVEARQSLVELAERGFSNHN